MRRASHMDKHSSAEDSVQCKSRRDEARPMCSVPPHQQLKDSLLLREYGEIEEEEEGNGMSRPDAFISLDNETDITGRRRKTALVRSKTLDPSLLLQVQSDSESKCERRKPQSYQSLRTNSQYHKVFKDIREDEELRQSYTCAIQKDILYQGRLFVSENWICFYSKVFGRDTKIVIPVTSVTVIKKTKTVMLVPNALVISTTHERHVFVSFLSRDTTYKVLMSVCPHLVGKSPGISQISSQRGHPAPADFSADLSDVDASVEQTHGHVDDSSSSDSPESPEFLKTPHFSKRTQAVRRDGELDPRSQQHAENLSCKGSSVSPEVTLMKTLKPVSLSFNTLVFIYVSLVCLLLLSSCYMAYKIMTLEERMSSLVTVEFPHEGDEYQRLYVGDTDEIYSVISVSLLKLEKIHRNLQKLLESLSDV